MEAKLGDLGLTVSGYLEEGRLFFRDFLVASQGEVLCYVLVSILELVRATKRMMRRGVKRAERKIEARRGGGRKRSKTFGT